MTLPGLGLFYAGLVQSKNILSVLMHCIAIACLVSVLWFALAYSLAFSAGSGLVGGLSKMLLIGVARNSVTGTIPETVFVMFQMTFAIITPALIVGAFVERVRFSSVLVFTGLWLILVYAPVAHWVWGGGWLAQRGVLDFAGGIVVHMTAGVSALTIAWLARPETRLSGSDPAAACAVAGDGRRVDALGRLVRLQRRKRTHRGSGRRHGDAGDASLRGGRLAGVDGD